MPVKKSEEGTEKKVQTKRGRPKKEVEVTIIKDVVRTKIDNQDVPKYHQDDLDIFSKIVVKARAEALEELKMLKDRIEDLQNVDFAEESMIYSMHMAEQGSESQEKEKTYAQIQRINEYLLKLDDARQRIEKGTYGLCRKCGCLIAKERLIAVPITTLSASYKIHQKCPDDGIDKIEAIK